MNVDPYHFSMFFGACAGITLVVCNAPMRWYLKATLLYFLLYQCTGFWTSIGTYSSLEIASKMGALRHLGTFLILASLVVVNEKWLRYFCYGIYTGLILDALWLLISPTATAFVGNTQDTLVMAVFIPIMFQDRYFRWFIPILLAAIINIQGAGSFVVLASHLVLLFFYGGSWFIGIAGLSLACGLSWYVSVNNLAGPRWATVWKEHLHWWGGNTNNWIGAGPGSFEWYSQIISHKAPRMWMHSDWLQIMFEYGGIGLVLSLALYSHVLWRLKEKPPEFLTMVALGLAMMIYSPIQFFWVQLLTALIVVQAVEKT